MKLNNNYVLLVDMSTRRNWKKNVNLWCYFRQISYSYVIAEWNDWNYSSRLLFVTLCCIFFKIKLSEHHYYYLGKTMADLAEFLFGFTHTRYNVVALIQSCIISTSMPIKNNTDYKRYDYCTRNRQRQCSGTNTGSHHSRKITKLSTKLSKHYDLNIV